MINAMIITSLINLSGVGEIRSSGRRSQRKPSWYICDGRVAEKSKKKKRKQGQKSKRKNRK